jgi:hypothetical protein
MLVKGCGLWVVVSGFGRVSSVPTQNLEDIIALSQLCVNQLIYSLRRVRTESTPYTSETSVADAWLEVH